MADSARKFEEFTEIDPRSVPNAPIDTSIPYQSRVKGASRHFGFFPFFSKKPWPVIQEYIRHFTYQGELVCDPFAGSGVTPVESLVLGRRAVSGDINPVARFITRMTAVSPIDLAALTHCFNQVEDDVKKQIEALDDCTREELSNILDTLDYPKNPIPDTVRRSGADTVDQLHTPRQLIGLTLLRDAINRVKDTESRDLLRVALAGAVRYCNTTYILPRDKGRQRSPYRGDAGFLRRFSFSPAAPGSFYENLVWPSFELRFKAVLKAKEETNRLIGNRFSVDSFTLTDVSASRIHEVTGEAQVDYIFTDPPYSNDINFLDLSVLWAAWLELDITDEARTSELMLRSPRKSARDVFNQQFAGVAESMARSLKPDRWLTLVYKHRDLSLWQTIVESCEDSDLRFVNAVWQDVTIRSTRQIESPNINPKGDMYLNFRKMQQWHFDRTYGPRPVVQLPTRTNYVEHEVERLIVSYLGADIALLTSGVIQQVLNNKAFGGSQGNFKALKADIGKVLGGPRFITWKIDGMSPHWVLAPGVEIDPTIDATDRARYCVFEVLREYGEVTEGQINKALLTRLALGPRQYPFLDNVAALLRNVAKEVAPHRWRLDVDRIAGYKQLRLLFQPSVADELRHRIDLRNSRSSGRILRADLEGFALLHERLREANGQNNKFETHYARLLEVLQSILRRLVADYDDQVDMVVAVGEWAQFGIDLRNLPYDDVILLIVVRESDLPFSLYIDMAERVFIDLGDDDVFIQFQLSTKAEWQLRTSIAQERGKSEGNGISLLNRT